MGLTLLTTKSLAKMLNLSVSTIKKKRVHDPNSLPPFIKIGRSSYRYDEAKVLDWLNERGSLQIECDKEGKV